MNTFTKSTTLPRFIYFKIDLRSEEARQGNPWTSIVASLPSLLSPYWAELLKADISEGLRERDILAKSPASAENNFATDTESAPVVICWKAQTIGVYEVTDWRDGLETVKASLQKWRLLQFSQIGWHDPNEMILRIVHPCQSDELMQPVFTLLAEWADNMQRNNDVLARFTAILQKAIPSQQPPVV